MTAVWRPRPYEPEAGHRFNPHKLVLDPYARAGVLTWALPCSATTWNWQMKWMSATARPRPSTLAGNVRYQAAIGTPTRGRRSVTTSVHLRCVAPQLSMSSRTLLANVVITNGLVISDIPTSRCPFGSVAKPSALHEGRLERGGPCRTSRGATLGARSCSGRCAGIAATA